MTARARRWLGWLGILVLQLAIVVALIDGAVALYLRHPVRAPRIQSVGRQIYGGVDRDIIQLNPAFARYDPELFYTLRPGRFVFAQREFATPFEVNSLGVRDDEAALDAPEIVVAGDSVAMGWGVTRDETFARRIARRTGWRVLNASVSSYGTVREMKLLDRVDRSRMRWLIVQYNVNDVGENKVFREHGNTHPAGAREKYDRTVRRQAARHAWYPGRYTLETLDILGREIRERIAPRAPRGPAPTADEEADWFLNALLHAGSVDFARVRVVVFQASADGVTDTLVPTLQKRRAAGTLPAALRDLIVLDVASGFDRDDFYVLDDHPNARAHRKIADAVLAAMGPSP